MYEQAIRFAMSTDPTTWKGLLLGGEALAETPESQNSNRAKYLPNWGTHERAVELTPDRHPDRSLSQ